MPTRDNELFIGTQHLNREGRSIKHPGLIRKYAAVSVMKIGERPIDLIALDLETDADTGELMLLGVYDEGQYRYFERDFLEELYMYVKKAKGNGAALAWWNRLDPFIIFKQFLLRLTPNEQKRSMEHYAKISGEYSNKRQEWNVYPVCQVTIGRHQFGIMNVLRSSIQFFIKDNEEGEVHTIWAYDIAQLYPGGLETEATKRFNYYSKVDKSAHLVDWNRYYSDLNYKRNIVLKSNYLDARACHDLGMEIQKDFKAAFGYYPRTLISQGSLARAAIVADITNTNEKNHADKKELFAAVREEVKSIGIMNYYDDWMVQLGQEAFKDMYCMFTEAYSGGYIEAIRYGYAKQGWYADIASAYPGVIQDLFDLRKAKVTTGTGTPPNTKNGYTFIRGTLDIPSDVNYHPVTVKHFFNKDTNIRPVGVFKGSYTVEEREYLEERGTTFSDETWYHIETTGERSVLADVCMNFIDLRKKLKAEGNSSEHMAKIAANSLYGILFEAVDTYSEQERETEIEHRIDSYYLPLLKHYRKNINLNPLKKQLKIIYHDDYQKILSRWHNKDSHNYVDTVKEELETQGLIIKYDNSVDILQEIDELYERDRNRKMVEIVKDKKIYREGYRAGEFWNPLYATIITSRTRLLMAKAADAIEKAGGKPIILMTDSITWQGTKEMLPTKFVREKKTLGYFETPEPITDIVCLGSGRYGFKNKHGVMTSKKRGLNAVEIHDPSGVILEDEFSWGNALEIMKHAKTDKINIKVRMLISPGLVIESKRWTPLDIGRIVEETREVDAIVGKSKRVYKESLKDPSILAKQLVETRPIELGVGMTGTPGPIDQTLPFLRQETMVRRAKEQKTKKKESSLKTYNKYKSSYNKKRRVQYKKLRDLGFTAKDADHMARWSSDRINKFLKWQKETEKLNVDKE